MASTSNKPDDNRGKIILGIVFGVVAVALIAAVVFTGSDDDAGTAAASEFGQPTVSGDSLPAVSEATVGSTTDPAVGEAIPEVSGQNFAGEPVEIKQDGQPKAILFVSHSCGHCQAEIPEVQAWLDETGGVSGVDLITVSTSAAQVGGNWPPSEWLAREGWTSPVIADDEDLSVFFAYGGSVIPYWVFVDDEGNVTRRWAGRLETELIEVAMLETLG
ncbi:MAG: TlpA disulfide reductase family protein [Acidimicrobiia bacterium]|nr:TlpA disulfide reductase family protein [Acidimicrobiia bacterium]